MTEGVFDTSVFVAMEAKRVITLRGLPPEAVVSVITVGELRAGVLAAREPETLAQRLSTLALAQAFRAIPIDEAVAEAWALLRARLREADRRMPINDSWIAATAMSLGVPVVTQDADYVTIPGLDVIRV